MASKIPKLAISSAPSSPRKKMQPKMIKGTSANGSPVPSPRQSVSIRASSHNGSAPQASKVNVLTPKQVSKKPISSQRSEQKIRSSFNKGLDVNSGTVHKPDLKPLQLNNPCPPKSSDTLETLIKELPVAVEEIGTALVGLIMPSSDHDMRKFTPERSLLSTTQKDEANQNDLKKEASPENGNLCSTTLTPPQFQLTPLEIHPRDSSVFTEDGKNVSSLFDQTEFKMLQEGTKGFLDEVIEKAAIKKVSEEMQQLEAANEQAQVAKAVKQILSKIDEDEEEEVFFVKSLTEPTHSSQINLNENLVTMWLPKHDDGIEQVEPGEYKNNDDSSLEMEEFESHLTPEASWNPFGKNYDSAAAASSMIHYTTLTTFTSSEEVLHRTSDEDILSENIETTSLDVKTKEISMSPSAVASGWVTRKDPSTVPGEADQKQVKVKQLFETASGTVEVRSDVGMLSTGKVEIKTPALKELEVLYGPRLNLNKTMSNVAVIPPETLEKEVTYLGIHRRNMKQIETEITSKEMADALIETEDKFFKSNVETQTSQHQCQPKKVHTTIREKEICDSFSFNRPGEKEVHEVIQDKNETDEIAKLPTAGEDTKPSKAKSDLTVTIIDCSGTETEDENWSDDNVDEGSEDEIFSLNLEESRDYCSESFVKPFPPHLKTLPGSHSHGTRKTKTIFSFEQPVTHEQNIGGYGENGDGCDALPSNSKQFHPHSSNIEKLRSESSRALNESGGETVSKPYSQEDLENAERIQPIEKTKEVLKQIYKSVEDDYNRPKVIMYGGTVEILPISGPTSRIFQDQQYPPMEVETGSPEFEHCSTKQCKAFLPTGSTLVLQRTSENGNVFRKTLNIHNSTSCRYAFKILCDSLVASEFSVRPCLGLIPPHSEISVNVSTFCKQNSVPTSWTHMDGCEKISLKIFRAECSDLLQLEKIYKELEKGYPDLIQTQSIHKIILWDSEDLSGTYRLLNSYKDPVERELIKEELHNPTRSSKSYTEVPLSSIKTSMENMQKQMDGFSQNLKDLFQELVYFRNTQNVITFVCMMLFVLALFVPHLCAEALWWDKKEEEVPKEEPWYRQII